MNTMISFERRHVWYIWAMMAMINYFLIGFFVTPSNKYRVDLVEELKMKRQDFGRQDKELRNQTSGKHW